MARWWRRWTVVGGGLLGLTSWVGTVEGQVPGYQPGGSPIPYSSPALGAPPSTPQGLPPNPLSLDYHGTPNGFSEEEYYPQPEPYVFKLKGEYLLWRVDNPRLSTIVATTSSNPNLVNGVGAIGDAGTSSLLGPGAYDYHGISGGRVTAGVAPGFMPPLEISGFWINTPSLALLTVASDGSLNSPVLARPFQAPNLPSLNGLGEQVVLSAGFPGLLAGTINVAADMSLWGIETNFFLNMGTSDVAGLDVIVGYRYTDLRESLSISNSVASVTTAQNISFNAVNVAGFPPGFTTTASDFFRTRNQFNGATLGLRPALYVGQFTTSADMKLAIGATHQTLNVNGVSSLLSPDGSVQSVPGGLLAVASNSGVTTHDVLSVVPELDLHVGFNVTRNVKFFATYNLFFWSNVVRPGDQLNNRVDSRQVPTDPTFDGSTQTQPSPSFVTRSFWGQGLSVGIEIGF